MNTIRMFAFFAAVPITAFLFLCSFIDFWTKG
jgi:hypothetical protein